MNELSNPKVRARIVDGRPDGHYQCDECHDFDFGHCQGCSQLRPFPIQHGGSIPWWLAEIAYDYYQSQWSGQSLERLAERGGFGVKELIMFIRRNTRHMQGGESK